MKKVYTFIILCTAFICTLSFCPVSAFQEDSFTGSQYEQIGSLGLGHLISDGQISELDFSNGSGDTSFLVALGKAIVTKDPTYVLEYGLDWAKDQALSQLYALNNWFADNFPRLYDFFTGSSHLYTYNPMPLETRKDFTHLLDDRVTTPDPVQPNPDVNYALYLELLNGKVWNSNDSIADFWLSNFNRNSSNIQNSNFVLDADPNMLSWISYNMILTPNSWNSRNEKSVSILNYSYYLMNRVIGCDPITIYINQVPDTSTYVATCSNIDLKRCFYNTNTGTSQYVGQIMCNLNNNELYSIYSYGETPNTYQFQYTGSLEDCFKVVTRNFRNVDVYVNGDIWAVGNFDPDDFIIYPIGIPDNFEILSGVQGGYYYPPDSYWNLNGLVQLIKQAISEYGVISISDIAPLIVDINGVQAVRTTNVARTDYDNLISEQYSVYPDESVLQVPAVVLDNGEIISFVATSSGSDLIPDDIMLVLCAGGLLTLIGLLINRMLE